MPSDPLVAEAPDLSLPQGGGALRGLGETFAPDLFTGTAHQRVPLDLPPGRHGLQPRLELIYSSGAGQGPFGLGWSIDVPAIARKTDRGVPRYADDDTFVLAGGEELVAVARLADRHRFRPRTEGLFARIDRLDDGAGGHWEVRTKDGLVTRYATTARDPARPERVFAWHLDETADSFGNHVRYEYLRDAGHEGGHHWDRPLLARIRYADYGDPAAPRYLVSVDFDYEVRPDPWSDRRAGFELRNTLRCRAIRVSTHAADGRVRPQREWRLHYEQAPFNGTSLLARVEPVGFDDDGGIPAAEQQPALAFGYGRFDPDRRRFAPVAARGGLPRLTDPAVHFVDLRGTGLPDLLQLDATPRWWANLGGGRFAHPRALADAPLPWLAGARPMLQDVDGDGRVDLVVSRGPQVGHYPLRAGATLAPRGLQRHAAAPDLADPGLRWVDLDGDGRADLLRGGARLHAWFNDADPARAWQRQRVVDPGAADEAPPLDLGDPHVRLADMTGDGLQDLVLVRSGHVAYWPNLGHGRWGARVQMTQAPRWPAGFDPRRVILADVDGDGLADLMWVDDGRVTLWANRSGHSFAGQPTVVRGTPAVADGDLLQALDLYGQGTAGLLWSRGDAAQFLDFTGGSKPHLLERIDNGRGALTRIGYRASTVDFLRDDADARTRWRTPLPVPVQVVARSEVHDLLARSRCVTHWRYRHGHWDGHEHEFRGFARVDQEDSESFDDFLRGGGEPRHFSPATLTKHWFHVGPVRGAGTDDWHEPDLRHEHWDGDPNMLERSPRMRLLLAALLRPARREALRSLRGQLLRTELYALDGSERQERPYTVTECLTELREETAIGAARVFFPYRAASRTTQWERGSEALTSFVFHGAHDEYGFAHQQLDVAVPRGRDPRQRAAPGAAALLATYATTEYARRDDERRFVVDRVARSSRFEVLADGGTSVAELRDTVFAGAAVLRMLGHERRYFDGAAHTGLPLGQVGEHGVCVRAEALAFDEGFLNRTFDPADPLRAGPRPAYLRPDLAVPWLSEYPRGFQQGLPPRAGYHHVDDTAEPGSPGGYYVVQQSHRYDFQDDRPGHPRGLLRATRDALGHQSTLEHDAHDLLPVRLVDAAGLVRTVRHDLRLLRPTEWTDCNGSTTRAAHGATGHVVAMWVRGPAGEGDAEQPSVTLQYDELAFRERGQPVQVRTRRRVHHDGTTGVPAGERDAVLESVEYSDGFGRLLQSRRLAEDTLFGDDRFGGALLPAQAGSAAGASTGRTRAEGAPPNVVVSGATRYDNKGRPVEQHEPHYDQGWDWAAPTDQRGLVQLRRDALGREVQRLLADGSQQRVVYGVPADLADPDHFTPTPWERHAYDANDNAGRTHGGVAAAWRSHWNTPSSEEIDALGRVVRRTSRNGAEASQWVVTRQRFDIEGNLVGLTDALGREAFAAVFDLLRRRWRVDSIDAGRRDTVLDAMGHTVEARDSKGALVLRTFDVLNRPVRMWARNARNHRMTLRERIGYGDAGTPAQPAAEREAARARGQLGRCTRHHDEAGLLAIPAYDFKGRVAETERRIVADAPVLAVYDGAAAGGWKVQPFLMQWEPGAGQSLADLEARLLETTVHRTSTRYDALDRVVLQRLPQDVQGRRRALRPAYNRGGALQSLRLDDEPALVHVAYDAQGRRTLVALGNGVMTRLAWDARTQRLVRRLSQRYAQAQPMTFVPEGAPLQDQDFEHDLVGNLLAWRERSPGCGLPGAPDALDRHFTYDALYRLTSGTGRETDLPPDSPPWLDSPRGSDLSRSRAYTQHYAYDALDNLLRMEHRHAGGGWTRSYTPAPGNNRIHLMRIGPLTYTYSFDANGNLRGETPPRTYEWDHADRLKVFVTQTPGAEPSVHAQYLYDAEGRRVKKLVRRQGGAVEVCHEVSEQFEVVRWTAGATVQEQSRVQVLDGALHVAQHRAGPAHPQEAAPAVQYFLDDPLGIGVVTDGTGAFVAREDFSPYGETTFGSFAKKRWRYHGMQRDEENGATYHRARYRLAHMARWCSADPIGPGDAVNLYECTRCNPLAWRDPGGLQSAPATCNLGPTAVFGPTQAPRIFGPPDPNRKEPPSGSVVDDAGVCALPALDLPQGVFAPEDRGDCLPEGLEDNLCLDLSPAPEPAPAKPPPGPSGCTATRGWEGTLAEGSRGTGHEKKVGSGPSAKYKLSAGCSSTVAEGRVLGQKASLSVNTGAEASAEFTLLSAGASAEAKLVTLEGQFETCPVPFVCAKVKVEAGLMLSIGAGYDLADGVGGKAQIPGIKAEVQLSLDKESLNKLVPTRRNMYGVWLPF